MSIPATSRPSVKARDRKIVLSVEDLEVSYLARRGKVQAVRGVTFNLREGETIALIGESGSGKTTLGNALVRMLPGAARVTNGQVLFYREDGTEVDVTALDDEQLRRFRWEDSALVVQSAINALNPVLRVREHFKDTWKAHIRASGNGRSSGRELNERALQALRYVQLDGPRVMRSFPHELSGGMRQRVMIALGLLLRPRVLILDEPTTALDVITQRAIIDVIRNLRQQLSFSMIFVSHDLSLAAELADRVVTMYAGRIVESADIRDAFYHPRHPYTVGLLNSVPTLLGENKDLTSIPGSPPDLIDLPTGCKFHPRCPFAQDNCRVDEPPALEVGPNHSSACWYWETVGNHWEGRNTT